MGQWILMMFIMRELARYYDPANSRMLTQDTYRGTQTEPASWNLYVYCANNPINYVDPSGHFIWAIPALWGLQALVDFSTMGLGVWAVSNPLKNITKSKPRSLTATLSASNINKRHKYDLFKRAKRLPGGGIKVTSNIKPYDAAKRLLKNGDIWTKMGDTAKCFAITISMGYEGPEIHLGKLNRYHYHLNGRIGGHIFYII